MLERGKGKDLSCMHERIQSKMFLFIYLTLIRHSYYWPETVLRVLLIVIF